jgi:hypothetical protein
VDERLEKKMLEDLKKTLEKRKAANDTRTHNRKISRKNF